MDGNLHINFEKPLPYPFSNLKNTINCSYTTTSADDQMKIEFQTTAIETVNTPMNVQQQQWKRPSIGVRLYTRGLFSLTTLLIIISINNDWTGLITI